ncbi:MAG: cyanase, partial [Nitrospira sp.]
MNENGKKAASDIIKAKRLEKKVTIAELAKAVGRNPTFVAAALSGNHKLPPQEAQKIGTLLDLDRDTTASLSKFPVRTDFPITTDPFKYRLLEIIGVYGDPMREMANEMFGDGIMSAIDFTLDMEKVTGSQGEARCKI